ncbi:hypothetical protein GQ55_5G048300 [Panicum hallii var. hallii]|uniref:Uncharacterized protein n=1 Tax=Panicum hallii var. hallii TaxID=1504633 RepID=A0A2T7DCT8_9POAL|nr:hypothetical protein GQ55_5G048300 [Panicum hallii var. hallii]
MAQQLPRPKSEVFTSPTLPYRPGFPDPEGSAGRRHPRGRASRRLPAAARGPSCLLGERAPPAGAVRGHAAAANPARRLQRRRAPARPPAPPSPRPSEAPSRRPAAAARQLSAQRHCPIANLQSPHWSVLLSLTLFHETTIL